MENLILNKFLNLLKKILTIKYLLIGILNSLFGYFIGVSFFNLFYDEWGIFFVTFFSNIFSILVSFINYKLFYFNKLFRNVFREFIKFYLIYILIFLISIIQLFLYIEVFLFNIYLSQGIIIFSNIIIIIFSQFFIIFDKKSY